MRLIQHPRGLEVRAPAKVNLFLEILGKRPDRFHEIATLMVALRLHDTLRFENDPTGAVSLTCNRADLSTGPDNLVVRAARLLQDRLQCRHGARIHLVKRIPMMAGLAGGSTDAAAVLLALNRLWNLNLTTDDLAKLGAELGSDVAFFFALPAAWCTGRGEVVRPVRLAKPINVVLVCPPFGCSTASVFRNLVVPNEPVSGQPLLDALASGELETVGRLLFNRLEVPAFQVAPELLGLMERIGKMNPLGLRMSGSGSTLFALCRDRREAQEFARTLRDHPAFEKCRMIVTRTGSGTR